MKIVKKLIRFVLYTLYLTLTGAGLVYLVAGLHGSSPWTGCGMLLAVCALGYAVSGFVKKYTTLAAVAAMMLTAAGSVFLLPYDGWNYVLLILNMAGVIYSARHNWGDEDSRVIDVRLLAAGLVISAIAYVVAVLNVCEAPQPQIGYTMYAYICMTILLVNRRTVQNNAGTQAGRMMRSNQLLAWSFVAIFSLAVFFHPLQEAVGEAIRSALEAFFNLFDNPASMSGPVTGDAPAGEMDLSYLDNGEVKEWPQWLKVLSDVLLHTITIVVVLAVAAGMVFLLVKAIKELSKYLKDWLATFGSAGNDDYAEESEQMMTAQSMRKQLQEDLTRRVKKLFARPVRWNTLTPNERVRHVYGHVLQQEKRIRAAAENMTPQELCRCAEKEEAFAALYGKVRYAEGAVTAEEAEKYRGYLKN